jgi:hypothetical protein
MGTTAQRERVEQKRGELEELGIDRDLRQQREKERQEKAERRVAAAAERQAQAEERAQVQRRRQQIHLEEAHQTEAREQAAREAEARHRRQQWEIYSPITETITHGKLIYREELGAAWSTVCRKGGITDLLNMDVYKFCREL